MTPLENTVGSYLVRRLVECGVTHVFGVPGDFVLRFMDYLVAGQDITLVTTCNELNAGYAADAYGKLQGIAAVCVTYNVGGISVLNAVVGAAAESVPLLVISGAPARSARHGRLLTHHTNGNLDLQRRIYQQVCIETAVLDDPQGAAAAIDRALQVCLTRKQPVYIEIPIDVVDLPLAAPRAPLDVDAKPPLALDDKGNLLADEVFRLLTAAKRPVILVGNELARFGLGGLLQELLEKSALPYITTMGAKGVISERDPAFLGTYAGSLFCSCAQKYLEQSDFVLNLGAALSDIDMTRRDSLCFPGVIARDGFAQFGGDGGMATISLAGLMAALVQRFGAARGAQALRDTRASLHERAFDDCSFWQDNRQSGQGSRCMTVTDEAPHERLTAALLFNEVRRMLSRETIVVADIGEALLSSAELPVHAPGGYLTQPLYLSIGYSLPATLGAAMAPAAAGKRVITLVGDGALQMTVQELSTIARERLNPIIILLNNDGYAIERAIHDGPYNNLQPWRYHELPTLFGANYRCARVGTPAELREALVRAFAYTEGPSFIEAQLDPRAISQPLKNLGASLSPASS